MQITLEIGPELEAEIARQAAEQGVAWEWCASRLLEEATQLHQRGNRWNASADSLGGNVAFGTTLVECFATARELLGGMELDFSRDPSPGRLVEIA